MPTVKTDGSSNVHYRSRLMIYGAPCDRIWSDIDHSPKHLDRH